MLNKYKQDRNVYILTLPEMHVIAEILLVEKRKWGQHPCSMPIAVFYFGVFCSFACQPQDILQMVWPLASPLAPKLLFWKPLLVTLSGSLFCLGFQQSQQSEKSASVKLVENPYFYLLKIMTLPRLLTTCFQQSKCTYAWESECELDIIAKWKSNQWSSLSLHSYSLQPEAYLNLDIIIYYWISALMFNWILPM